jgi:hypothetical protein
MEEGTEDEEERAYVMQHIDIMFEAADVHGDGLIDVNDFVTFNSQCLHNQPKFWWTWVYAEESDMHHGGETILDYQWADFLAENFNTERNNMLRTILESPEERHVAEASFPFLWRTFANK